MVNVNIEKTLELDCQQVLIPCGRSGKLVVGQAVSALVCLAQMREPADRHRLNTQALGGFDACMPAMIWFASPINTGLQKPNFLSILLAIGEFAFCNAFWRSSGMAANRARARVRFSFGGLLLAS
jgi:hypothetical protein